MKERYSYRVRTEDGQLKKGVVWADGTSGAASYLRQQNYWIIDLKQVSSGRGAINLLAKKSSAKDLAVFSRQFASLLISGTPVLKALSILSNQLENRKFKLVLRQVMINLGEGCSLSEALSCHPRFFPKVFTSMITAGEAGGILSDVLSSLSLHFERICELTEKVKTALTYPVLVVIFSLISVVFLLAMVLPTLQGLLHNVDTTLPLITLTVLRVNKLLAKYWYLIACVFLMLPLILMGWISTARGKKLLDKIVMRLPVLGTLVKKVILARFCRTLGILVAHGVPMLTALETVKETTESTVMIQVVSRARCCIEVGESLAATLQNSGFFPPLVINMIAVGEETGSLDQQLQNAADLYEREIDAAMARISSLIEPFLVILVGGIVGIVVIAILLPVYQTIGAFE